jgi:pyruvyl transferase EpsO
MAFSIPQYKLERFEYKISNMNLFLKRIDKEFNNDINYSNYIAENNIDITDWPTMERLTFSTIILNWLLLRNRKKHFPFSNITNIYVSLFFKPDMIRTGINFVNKYKKIYTTRLHGAILCCLLEKPFIIFNNSYGKNKCFFETWFNDLEQIEFH